MNQTAVEFLQKGLSIHFTFEQQMQFEGLFQHAKELEKTLMCSFTTSYVNDCVEIDHNEIELTKEVEEYYDWLESTKCQCDEGFCETRDNCKGLYSKI